MTRRVAGIIPVMANFAVDFGRTSQDYRAHRAGFPPETFERLERFGIGLPGQRIADLGTGTGAVALALAARGPGVVGVDAAAEQIAQARAIAAERGCDVEFVVASAEETGLGAATFDIVIAGQCWHWFDREGAAAEARRLLRPDGKIVIAHFDWLPLPGNAVEVTETLIARANPLWRMGGGSGVYPAWFRDLLLGGFADLESFSFDTVVPYSHEDWRGRIRASAGIGATLPEDSVRRFDKSLASTLKARYPNEPLDIPHRVWVLIGRRA